MQGWLFTGAHEPLQLIERETPRPGPGEVLLAVRGSGLCHSDVGRMDGTLTPYMPKKPPIILGHEVAGVVVEAGESVTGYVVGDRVVASGTVEFCPGRQADGETPDERELCGRSRQRLPLLSGRRFAPGSLLLAPYLPVTV